MILRIFKRRRRTIYLLPRTTQMEIICGDCAGDEIYPEKTILMSDGTCANCGGRSFVCAVRLFKMLTRHFLTRQKVKTSK